MLLSFKTRLEPNNKQRSLFAQHAGTARHAYNWANAVVLDVLKQRESDKSVKVPSAIDLHKRLVAEVKSDNPWYYLSNKNAPQQALKDLRKAWDRCFKKTSKQPRFKKKGVKDSFYLESGTKAKPKICTDGKRVKLPTIGWIKLSEELPIAATHNCTISRAADDWFIAIKVEVEQPTVASDRPDVGVDVGLKSLAVLSDGTEAENPKAYRKHLKQLKRLQRSVSRKQKGSSNRKKAVRKLAKLHQRIANIRKDAIHKLTTHLAKNHSTVKIEDLNVSGFLKNHRLAGAIADAGLYEFKRQLEYKCEKFQSELVIIDRWFPSSQICSGCNNHRHKMPLKERVYHCPDCGTKIDRDLNAAINIKNWHPDKPIPAVSSTVVACGAVMTPSSHARSAMKQELITKDCNGRLV